MSFTIYMIIMNTSFWLILNYGVAYGVQLLPESIFQNNFFFKEKSLERKLYKCMRIKDWKEKVPTMNPILKKLKKERTPDYLEKVMMQTYYAELGHVIIAIVGFLSIVINPSEYFLMALISSIVNFFIHIPFCLIQRYNRPRIRKLRTRIENHF